MGAHVSMPDFAAEPQPVAVDAHALSREELIELLEAQHEGGIRIDFVGKSAARKIARKVRPRTLQPIKKYSAGDPTRRSRNLVIQGDNLQAMTTLFRERGHIDMIVTDPPYNTGRDFRYNDRWDEDPNDPGLGEFVEADDGARHTKWMRFMWTRLQLMKSMLKPGGVLAICIDHRELFHLGPMLDELFKPQNRLAIINWEKAYSPRNDKGHVSVATEYVLVYARDRDLVTTSPLERTVSMDAAYRATDGDPRRWKPFGDLSAGKGKGNQGMVYAIQSPFTGELHYPSPGRCWARARSELKKALEEWGVEYRVKRLADDEKRAELLAINVEDIKPASALVLKTDPAEARAAATQRLKVGTWPSVYWASDGHGRPFFKRYLEDVKQGKVPTTWWADEDYDLALELGSTSWRHEESGHSQTGIDELDAIVGPRHGFRTVKPLKLITKLITIWCPPDGTVLDPFAGSGTTGHAVMHLNEASDADRRFVLIEQGAPDRGDSYAQTLLADRLQRVIAGDWASGPRPELPSGFTFHKLHKKVDAEAVLSMERDELAETIIASYGGGASRRREALVTMVNDHSCKYLVARNADGEGFFLVWNGSPESVNFTEKVYEACAEEAARAGLQPRYHVYARLYLFQTDNVVFYTIPDRILMDFGLDLRAEPYYEHER